MAPEHQIAGVSGKEGPAAYATICVAPASGNALWSSGPRRKAKSQIAQALRTENGDEENEVVPLREPPADGGCWK
jgi:hypothetical protein